MQTATTTTEQMPPGCVSRLLAAKGLDAWQRTIRNGILAARRDGRTYFIGATALAYYVDAERLAGARFEARADGTVWTLR